MQLFLKTFCTFIFLLGMISVSCDKSINRPTQQNSITSRIIELNSSKKKKTRRITTNEKICISVRIANPQSFESISINFGEPKNPANIIIDKKISMTTSSISDVTKNYPITYKHGGLKKITITGTVKGSQIERLCYDSVRIEESEPEIFNQPSDATVGAGERAVFFIEVGGEGITYQWLRDGNTIEGADAATYSFIAEKYDNQTQFACIVSNQYGSITSNSALLTVVETDQPPIILSQPENITVENGQTAQFNISANRSNLTYQWLRDGNAIDGADAATYSFTAETSDNNATFSCVVSNPYGSVTSNEALLTVVQTDQPPTITTQPENITIENGQIAEFRVSANRSNLTYQWQKNGYIIDGANAATYTFIAQTSDNNAAFSCVVSNPYGSTTSNEAIITVIEIEQPPTISTQPENVTVEEGQTAEFRISAKGSDLTYQWQKNGIDIGTNENTLTIPSIEKSDDRSEIVCIVSNAVNSIKSATASITVIQKQITSEYDNLDLKHPAYRMNYTVDYKFDKLLERGAKTPEEIQKFIKDVLKKNNNIADLAPHGKRCSGFTAQGSKQGDKLFGHNEDWDEKKPHLLVSTKPTNGFASLSIVMCDGEISNNQNQDLVAAPFYPMTGINSEGLAVSTYWVEDCMPKDDPTKTTLYWTCMIRLLLDRANNVLKAKELLEQHNIYFPNASEYMHILIGDAKGASFIVEWLGSSMIFVDKQKNWQIVTNYKQYNVDESILKNQCRRFKAVSDILEKNPQGIQLSEGMTTLQAASTPSDKVDQFNPLTRFSIFYNLNQKTADIVFDMNYETEYHFKYDGNNFIFIR